jgi:hypothetical protein
MTIAVIIFAAVLLYAGYTMSSGAGGTGDGGTSAPPSPDNDNVPQPLDSGHLGLLMPITNDPATWPSGSPIWSICQAIALAEGAHMAGSVPDRLNNPGDISDGGSVYGSEAHSGSNVTHFPTKEIGWSWLYSKVLNAATGQSRVYLPSMTWVQIAQKWAGNWQAWVGNVTTYLGVDPNSTLNQYTGYGS